MTDSEGNEIGKVFVGGISQNTNNVSLRIYFSQFGELEDAVVMMDNKTGRSRGFGYVKFRDPECVKVVLASKPHWLDGKEIDAKQCNVNMKGRNRRSLKIFVGGIGLDQDVASITTFFEKFGRVTDVNLMMDPNKQRHRGFAFIGFEEEIVVNRLINMHYMTMGNKQVEIKAMEPPNFGRKNGPSISRITNELNDLRDSTTRDTILPQPSGKQPPKNRNNQHFSNLQYGAGPDGGAYGLSAGHQQGYLSGFAGDATGQMQQGRLMGEHYASGMYSMPGKVNTMPVIFANSFVPIAPTVYSGCQAYPYPILQPQFLHPGLLSGNEEFWSHGICPQQQVLFPPTQSTAGPGKTNSSSQTSPTLSKSYSGFCDNQEGDRGKAFDAVAADNERSKTGIGSCINSVNYDGGTWCLAPTRFAKVCTPGACVDQHTINRFLIHNQETPVSRHQQGPEHSENANQQANILAKPSGDNFDRDEAVSSIHDGGLTVLKEEENGQNEGGSAETNKDSSHLQPYALNANWLLQRPQQLTSPWHFRPPFWGDVQFPPAGFTFPPGFILQPASTPAFDPTSLEHSMGGFGYSFSILSDLQSLRDDATVVTEQPGNSLLSANPTFMSPSLQTASTSGNLRQRRRESPEVPTLVGLHQHTSSRYHDTMGRWMPQNHSNLSTTLEMGKKATADEAGGKGGGGGGGVGGCGGSEGMCTTEKTSVAAGDHHVNNYRGFRI